MPPARQRHAACTGQPAHIQNTQCHALGYACGPAGHACMHANRDGAGRPPASTRRQPPPAGGQRRGLGPPAALARGRVKHQPARLGADWRACRGRGAAATAVESPSWRWGALTLLAALLCRCQQCRSQEQRQERRRRPHSSWPNSVARAAPSSIAAVAAHAFLKVSTARWRPARPKLRQSPSTCPSSSSVAERANQCTQQLANGWQAAAARRATHRLAGVWGGGPAAAAMGFCYQSQCKATPPSCLN